MLKINNPIWEVLFFQHEKRSFYLQVAMYGNVNKNN